MSNRFGIDSLAMRDGLLFGWGWFLADAAPVAHLRIIVRHPSGTESRLVCTLGGARTDVAAAHPDIAHAASAGFIVHGRLRGEWRGSRSELQAELTDGSRIALPVEGFPFPFLGASASKGSLSVKFSASLSMLRKGDFTEFLNGLRRFASARIARLRSRHRVVDLSSSLDRMELIFDHALGGGANRFSARVVAEVVARGGQICMITPDLARLGFRIRVTHATGVAETACRRLPDVLAFLDRQRLTLIHVNELVSFDDPFLLTSWICAQARRNVPIRFYLHDFHAVCPSWNLIDAGGRYCAVPRPEICAHCLPRLEIPFLAFQPETDIGNWRLAWGELLCLSEIVAFSSSSAAILRRAYPDLDQGRIVVRPHVVDYMPDAPMSLELAMPNENRPLIVGVVGTISVHKGANIVWGMAALIKAQQLPVRIVVIGSIENAIDSDEVTILGPYQLGRLPQLLRDARVDIGLVPSICPETYSLVASELMQLQMPLVVFDLGAPAERVANYPRGRVASEVTAEAALDSIQRLHRDLVEADMSTSARVVGEGKPEQS